MDFGDRKGVDECDGNRVRRGRMRDEFRKDGWKGKKEREMGECTWKGFLE